MTSSSQAQITSVRFVMSRKKVNNFSAILFIHYDNNQETRLTKDWPGRTLGFVQTELNKLKNEFIREGVPVNKITVVDPKCKFV